MSRAPIAATARSAKVDACAVCGTDLKAYNHGNPRIKAPKADGPRVHRLDRQVGEDVAGFAVGDRVVMATSVSCGECYYCRRAGRTSASTWPRWDSPIEGGMAEYRDDPGPGTCQRPRGQGARRRCSRSRLAGRAGELRGQFVQNATLKRGRPSSWSSAPVRWAL